MPKLRMPIPETELSVTRPVVLEIARKLCKLMGISPNTQIYFPLEGQDKRAQAGSVMGSQEIDEANYLPFSQLMRLDVEEQFNDQAYVSQAIHKPEQFPIFRDDALYVLMKPVYTNNEFTINFKFRAADKVLAERFRDEMKTRWSDGSEVYKHSVTFHWEPPHAFLEIIKEIHRLRENVLPYGEDFDTYFKACTDARMSVMVNQAGTQGAMNLSETQGNVIGYFDFSGGVTDKGSKDDEADTWVISFAYKFRFEKPIQCVLHYPLVVHNQMLGAEWRPALSDDQNRAAARSYTRSADAFSQFRAGKTDAAFTARNGYDVPSFDEFIPLSVVSETLRIFTALCKLNLADTRELITLTELGKIKFSPLILDFLKVEATYMPKTYNSVFVASLYEGIELTRSNAVTVDQSLRVRSVTDLDPRKVHHFRLALVTDWTLLTQPAIDRLTQNGAATLEIIKAIAPWITLPTLTPRGTISPGDMQNVIDQLHNQTGAGNGLPPGANGSFTGQHIGFNTVGTLFIEAYDKK